MWIIRVFDKAALNRHAHSILFSIGYNQGRSARDQKLRKRIEVIFLRLIWIQWLLKCVGLERNSVSHTKYPIKTKGLQYIADQTATSIKSTGKLEDRDQGFVFHRPFFGPSSCKKVRDKSDLVYKSDLGLDGWLFLNVYLLSSDKTKLAFILSTLCFSLLLTLILIFTPTVMKDTYSQG